MEPFEVKEFIIKNMVCSRCLKVVRRHFESLGMEVLELHMGSVKARYPKGTLNLEKLTAALAQDDFEIIRDREKVLTEQIKRVLLRLVNDLPVVLSQKLSDYLVGKLHRDYTSLSKTFSKTEGVTIERYFILLRIEKAKELIEYGELSFSQIAYELGYTGINHLSNQFKQVTGMSMSTYKSLKDKPRNPLDKIL
ncbi:MAG: AraC family transcriptional regulator [Bacteroidetes bacterium]|nr:MAG: AraC family transcriptional regulator [Bacteroidota bacterium]